MSGALQGSGPEQFYFLPQLAFTANLRVNRNEPNGESEKDDLSFAPVRSGRLLSPQVLPKTVGEGRLVPIQSDESPVVRSSGHMYKLLDPRGLREMVHLAVRALQYVQFDTIAFRGMSGAFLGPAVAATLDKQMILVRKPDDDTHSFYTVEGNQRARRYVIVDDFQSSGATKRTIIESVREFSPDAAFVGFLGVLRLSAEGVEHYYEKQMPYPLQ